MVRIIPLLALALALSACPTEGDEPIPDITWDPPLLEDGRGELDLGLVAEGNVAQAAITGTNNTDGTISFELDWDFVGNGWLVTAVESYDAEPGEQPVTFGPRYSATDSSPDSSSGTVTFSWDGDEVTYDITVQIEH
jgi:hypothetical protein